MNMWMIFLTTATNAPKTAESFKDIAQPIIDLIGTLVTPVLGIVVAIAAVYAIILGAKLAKAEEPQEREKAKQALKNGVVGFFLIFVLLLALRLSYPMLVKWVNDNSSAITTQTTDKIK